MTPLERLLASEEFDAAMYHYRTTPGAMPAAVLVAFEAVKQLILHAAHHEAALAVPTTTATVPPTDDGVDRRPASNPREALYYDAVTGINIRYLRMEMPS